MAVKLFSKEELQKCTTEKEVEAYFDSLGIHILILWVSIKKIMNKK